MEPDEDVKPFLKRELDTLDIEYEMVSDGKEALEMFEKGHYSLVSATCFSGGFGVLKHAKQTDPEIKTVLCTGDPGYRNRINPKYLDGVITKPFELGEYADSVREVLGLPE